MSIHTETSSIIPKSLWTNELKWLLRNSLPVSGYYLLLLSSKMVGVMALGHLGTAELAASALATVFASMTAFSVTYGAISALDTLCSQAWTGAHDRTLLGVHLQRAMAILGCMYIAISVLWLNATTLFRMIGQDPQVAHNAGECLSPLLSDWSPGVQLIASAHALSGTPDPSFLGKVTHFQSYSETLRKYLQAQGIMSASTWVQVAVVPISCALVYILTFYTSFGLKGVPIASSITFWLMLLGLLAYTRYVRGWEAWGGWSLRKSFTDWRTFFWYALPGMINTLAEWWCFELVSLGASYLGQTSLAAQSILMCLDDMTSALGWGISTAAAIRVGHRIGHGIHPRQTIYAACGLAFGLGSLATAIIWLLRFHLAHFFSADAEMVTVVADMVPLFATYLVAKTIANTLTGILRGIGRPDVTARINLPAYYAVGFPVAYWAGFKIGWGLAGLWSGLCCAIMLAATGHIVYLAWLTDWDPIMQKTRDRIKAEEEHTARRTL